MNTQGFSKLVRIAAGTVAAAGIALALSACYTVEGVGKDVKSAGNAVERGAERSTPY